MNDGIRSSSAPRAASTAPNSAAPNDYLPNTWTTLWFLDDVGPIKVPEAASAVARPGWTINLVLGRRGSTWDVLEVGNLYPEPLA